MESQETSSCSNSNFSKMSNKSASGWSDDDDFFGGGQEESGVMVPSQTRSEGFFNDAYFQ